MSRILPSMDKTAWRWLADRSDRPCPSGTFQRAALAMVPQSWIRFLEQPRHLRHRPHWNAALAGASSPPSSGVSVVLLVVHPLAFSFRLGPLWRAFSCRAV